MRASVTLTTTGSAGWRSANTCTSTVIEDLPTATTSAWKLTMSPTEIGCLKTKEFTAIVTTCERARRIAGRAPAMSTIAMTQPPNTSPAELRSAGIGIRRNAGSVAGGVVGWEGLEAALMGCSTDRGEKGAPCRTGGARNQRPDFSARGARRA